MRELIWGDLRANRAVWLWALIVVAACGACFGAILTSSATVAANVARNGSEAQALELQSLTSVLTSFIGIATCAVVASTMRLVVTAQSRVYAVWKVIGLSGARVRAIILAQLVTIGVAGGLLGSLLALPVTLGYIRTWSETGLPIDGPLALSPWVPIGTIAVTVGFCVLGGWRQAAAAARTSELQALRESSIPKARVGWGAIVGGVALIGLAAMCYYAGQIDGLSTPADPDAVLGSSLMLLAAALVWGAWTLCGLQHLWTALLPDGLAFWWHLARRSCLARSAQTVNAAMPYALALAITGVLEGVVAATAGQANGFGMLFGLIFAIATAGGVGCIAMLGTQRRKDSALLEILGASPRACLGAQLAEALIYAVTGTLFGLLATLGAGALTAFTLHVPFWTALARVPWVPLAAMGLGGAVLSGATAVLSAASREPSPVRRLLGSAG